MAFHYTGKKTVRLYLSITLFFLYLGYLVEQFITHWRQVAWKRTLTQTMHAGSLMVLPLCLISMLLAISISLSIHYLLMGFKLHNQAMHLVQSMIIRDFAALPIGFVLCVHCGLNLIESRHAPMAGRPQKITLDEIIPLMLGLNVVAVLLYTYVIFSFFVGTFLTSYYFLGTSMQDYWLGLDDSVQVADMIESVCKTIAYASIAGISTGYYYFTISRRHLSLRLGVSRIITRGLFWQIVLSVVFKL